MRRALKAIVTTLHFLIGSGAAFYLAYIAFNDIGELLKASNLTVAGFLLFLVAYLGLGIGMVVSPARIRRWILGFHLTVVILSVLAGAFLVYLVLAGRAGGYGGLVVLYLACFLGGVIAFSLVTWLVFRLPENAARPPDPVVSERRAALRLRIWWFGWRAAAFGLLIGVIVTLVESYREQYEYEAYLAREKGRDQLEIDMKKIAEARLADIIDREIYIAGEQLQVGADPWGTPISAVLGVPGVSQREIYSGFIDFHSAGPDRNFDTRDDVRYRHAVKKLLKLDTQRFVFNTFADGSTRESIQVLAESVASYYPYHVDAPSSGEYVMDNRDKWGRNLVVRFAIGRSGGAIEVASAGQGGIAGNLDDLVITRDLLVADARETRTQNHAIQVTPAAAKARLATYQRVAEAAIENARIERIVEAYRSPASPADYGLADAWGRPIRVYHANTDRTLSVAWSTGADGVGGNFDDIVHAASNAELIEQLSEARANRDLPSNVDERTPFFEIFRSRQSNRFDLLLSTTGAAAPRSELTARYGRLTFVDQQGQSCPAGIEDFVRRPTRCCPRGEPILLAGRYSLDPGCALTGLPKFSLPGEVENLQFFDMESGRERSGDQLARLALRLLYESCQYHRQDDAEFYYCRPRQGGRPHRSYLLIDGEIVFAQDDYSPLGVDGHSYYENARKDFVASFDLDGEPRYLMRAGPVIHRNPRGTWVMSRRYALDHYDNCECEEP